MGKHVISKPVLLCAGLSFLFLAGQAYGEETAKVDSPPATDKYLTIEALCGEDMPFFKGDYTPPKKYVKTKINEKDMYLSLEALCGDDPSHSYKLIIPEKYIRVKHDPNDLQLDLEKIHTEDPSFVKGQEKD